MDYRKKKYCPELIDVSQKKKEVEKQNAQTDYKTNKKQVHTKHWVDYVRSDIPDVALAGYWCSQRTISWTK